MTSYAIQAGALRTNPNSGPDGIGVQADIAYTLEARAEVQAVCGAPANDNRPVAVSSNAAGKNGLRFLSVCSGIEAASVAWPQWQAVAFSEIEKFPSAVLAHHYPDVPNLGDMTGYKEWPDFHIDLLCGGTPCQAFSVAGLREGLNDPRGNLTLTFLGIAEKYKPQWIVWENVPGIFSDKTGALVSFLTGLEELGYVIDIDVLDAQYFGLAQRRRRVIVCGQNIKHILATKTISSALTIAQFLQEISLSTLEELTTPSTSVQLGSGSNATSAAHSRQRKMRLFGLLPGGVVSTSAGSLAEHLQWLEQELNGLASADGSSFQGATSHLGGIEPPTSLPTIMDLREGFQSTEPSWLNILAAPLQMMSESTISTASKAITESKIYTCAQMTLCITKLMHQSIASSPVFWSAAQSSLIALRGFINYARQTSSDLFAGMEWVRSWNDFIEQAVPVAEAIGCIRVECFGEVLPFSEGVRRDTPPSR